MHRHGVRDKGTEENEMALVDDRERTGPTRAHETSSAVRGAAADALMGALVGTGVGVLAGLLVAGGRPSSGWFVVAVVGAALVGALLAALTETRPPPPRR
jgi:uncharacterized oligopeptide transporter (OPT) family protein